MLTKKQTIVMISRTVRRAEDKVALNETWKTLNLQHGIGRLQGRQLALSDQDHQHLRRLLIMTMNLILCSTTWPVSAAIASSRASSATRRLVALVLAAVS